MANRQFEPLLNDGTNRVVVEGYFDLNGASNPASPVGKGFTVARQSQSVYRITWKDAFSKLLAFVPSLELATATDQSLVWKRDATNNAYVDVTIWDVSVAGAAADIAADPNNNISFIAIFRNTGVTP